MEFTITPEMRERQALHYILADAKVFYSDPKNVKAFEAWQKENERREKNDASNPDPSSDLGERGSRK